MPKPASEQPERHPPAGSRRGRGKESRDPSPAGDVADRIATVGTDEGDADQTGVDVRRRGWFWHWNTVVTQYAPLIGLKGVGLLNSYTVWTDRREESPHRGYAFPSQQAEADFYGEDRAELITINKILVALDLIEIRKEMVVRADERGRRWRVPHNLYRVKDRVDGVTLRAADVMSVAHLAAGDEAVFRYTRRIFSPRFEPIDRDSVWHAILVEISDDPLWQSLQDRTRQVEERASARTRAGHRQRARSAATNPSDAAVMTSGQSRSKVLHDSEHSGGDDTPRPTSVAPGNDGREGQTVPVVASTNTGSTIDVDPGNEGSPHIGPTSAAQSSNGSPTAVAPGNTTYHQDQITTTTTTTTPPVRARMRPLMGESRVSALDDRGGVATRAGQRATKKTPTDGEATRWPVVRNEAQEDVPDEGDSDALDGAVGANPPAEDSTTRTSVGPTVDGRRAGRSTTEWSLAHASDERASGPVVDPGPLVISVFEAANDRRATPLERILLGELARDADPPARAAGSAGSDWVVAALREAVASGSAFVAPKRIREIIQRWAVDGDGPRGAGDPVATTPAIAAGMTPTEVEAPTTSDDVRLPGGARGLRIWAAVLDDLSGVLATDAFDLLLGGSAIRRYWRGMVEVEVASQLAAEKLSTEYRALVERQLNSRLSKPVAISFHVAEPDPLAATPLEPAAQAALVVSRADVDLGRQVWHAVLADLSGALATGDAERMAGVVPLGQDSTGLMLLASPSPIARRLLDERYRADVERSLSTLLGHDVRIRCIGRDEWSVKDDDAGARG